MNDKGDGIANVCVDLACEQAATGSTVTLACAPGGFVDLVVGHGVAHEPIDFRWRSPISMVRAVRELSVLVRRFDPQIVHAHTVVATVVARLACTRTRSRVVATVHNEYQRGVFLMGVAHRVVGVSEAVSAAMAKRWIPRTRIRTVRNGVVGSVRRRLDASDVEHPVLSQPSIVAIGAVSRRKGADVLIDAFSELGSRFPSAALYFVGNVDWPDAVVRANDSPHAARIHFLGFSAQPQAYLAAASVFALASRRDPFPLVLLEALECGTPIVAAAVDGIPEALDGGGAGILVRSEAPSEFAAAIGSLFDSPTLSARYSAAARERSTHFSVATMTIEYSRVYDGLSSGH